MHKLRNPSEEFQELKNIIYSTLPFNKSTLSEITVVHTGTKVMKLITINIVINGSYQTVPYQQYDEDLYIYIDLVPAGSSYIVYISNVELLTTDGAYNTWFSIPTSKFEEMFPCVLYTAYKSPLITI